MTTFLKAYMVLAVLAVSPAIGFALIAIWFYRARKRQRQVSPTIKLTIALTQKPPIDSEFWDRRRAPTTE